MTESTNRTAQAPSAASVLEAALKSLARDRSLDDVRQWAGQSLTKLGAILQAVGTTIEEQGKAEPADPAEPEVAAAPRKGATANKKKTKARPKA